MIFQDFPSTFLWLIINPADSPDIGLHPLGSPRIASWSAFWPAADVCHGSIICGSSRSKRSGSNESRSYCRCDDLSISWNAGTRKSSILDIFRLGFSMNHPAIGVSHFWNPPTIWGTHREDFDFAQGHREELEHPSAVFGGSSNRSIF